MDLIEQNIGLVRWAANRYRGDGIEYEDAFGICLVRAYEVIHKYDASKATFATFLAPYLRGAILDYRRRIYGRKQNRKYQRPYVGSLDELLEDNNFDFEDEGARIPEDLSYVWCFVERLEPRLQKIIYWRYKDGLMHGQIASKLDVSETRAQQLHKKAIRELRKMQAHRLSSN